MRSNSYWLEWLLLVSTGLLLTTTLYAYVRAESGLREQFDVPLEELEIPSGGVAIAEGERLATIRGCFWCHGASLEGQQYFARAGRGVIVIAPDLTRKVREYSVGEFARSVRHGVRPDRTSVQPAMPAFAYYNMSNEDMALIIAYVRSLPEQKGFSGEFRLLPIGWLRWTLGELPPNAAALIDHTAPRPDPALAGPVVQRGRYLAESICTECHGDNGRIRVPITPDLEISATYSREDFVRLIRTGTAAGDREIDYHMVEVAKYRYVRLTDDEVDALYAYFQSMLGVNAQSGS